MPIVPFGRRRRRSVDLAASCLAAPRRRRWRGRYRATLARTLGAVMPMLSATSIAGTRLSVLLLGVRGA
eukprot:15456238-Alexandrium_andersonii.AAC.1